MDSPINAQATFAPPRISPTVKNNHARSPSEGSELEESGIRERRRPSERRPASKRNVGDSLLTEDAFLQEPSMNMKRTKSVDEQQEEPPKEADDGIYDITSMLASRRVSIRDPSPRNSTPKEETWSLEQDQLLRAKKDQLKSDWDKIAACYQDKTPGDCEQRWKEINDPVMKRGAWTQSEDERLIQLVKTMKLRHWGELSIHIPGRSSKQCRERWCYNLDPRIKKDAWTPEEDAILLNAQAKMGNKWAQIASLLEGRTENAIKTRYKSIKRAMQRAWTPEEDATLMRLHARLGSRWDTIALSLPRRTKNAVKTRYRSLVGGKTATSPQQGAPNQILHYESASLQYENTVRKPTEGYGVGQAAAEYVKQEPNTQKRHSVFNFDLPASIDLDVLPVDINDSHNTKNSQQDGRRASHILFGSVAGGAPPPTFEDIMQTNKLANTQKVANRRRSLGVTALYPENFDNIFAELDKSSPRYSTNTHNFDTTDEFDEFITLFPPRGPSE
mmetsp:Transcript_18477/g.39998  ORF Transcript_18477/g.39998 Transcript_18477/m.39998 type:complete len:502 (-) Transcript_18477:18-1523(-)